MIYEKCIQNVCRISHMNLTYEEYFFLPVFYCSDLLYMIKVKESEKWVEKELQIVQGVTIVLAHIYL